MLKYILVLILGFSATYGFDYKFTNPIDMPNTYVAMQGDYYIQVDYDSLVVYKDDIAIYHKSFSNCTKIEKSSLDSFRIKRYYDKDKIDTILFYSKLDLFDGNNRNIGKISISKDKLEITHNNKVKEIEFFTPIKENLLNDNIKLDIAWSSFYGGTGDDVLARIFSNSMGDMVVGGYTKSTSFNGKSPIMQLNSKYDVVLMTLTADGDMKWLTYIGSENDDYFYSLAIDKDDNIWVSCETRGGDFYTTPKSYKYAGGTADAALCHFSKDGDVIFSTVMGGGDYDALTDIQIGKDGKIWACGRTVGNGFPVTNDAEIPKNFSYGGILVGLTPDYKLFYSTYYNILSSNEYYFNSDCLRVDNDGNIIIVGTTNSKSLLLGSNSKYGLTNHGNLDVYLAKFDSFGKIMWARFIGGSNNDASSSIAIDSSNNILLNVITASTDIECKGNSNTLKNIKSNLEDNYLVKYSPDGELIWGGYFGGNNKDSELYDGLPIVRSDIKIAPQGEIVFTFFTTSTDLIVNDKSQYSKLQGEKDAFVLLLDSNTNYLNSTYLGGQATDYPACMLLHNDKLYLLGYTISTVFPIINRNSVHKKGGNDGFIVCFDTGLMKMLPPEISDFEVSDCNLGIEYVILDKNIKPGFKPAIIYRSDNCKINSKYEYESESNIGKLTINIDRLDNTINAYYKLEIDNLVDKKILIEDSLLASAENFIRFEPNGIVDFGEQSIYNREYCKNITIYNDGPSDFALNDAYFLNNINFSYPTSQLPLVFPANSSREFTLCSSPMRLNSLASRDTFIVISPCADLYLPVSIVYNFPELINDTKCVVPISVAGNIEESFSTQSLVSNSNVVDLEINKAEDYDISIYNSLSTQINTAKISKLQSNIEIDFTNLANGMYFIYINSAEKQKIVRILLMR